MEKITGILGYNYEEERMGILSFDLWVKDGLHCGETLEVLIDDEWVSDRIEYSSRTKEWYLVNTKLSGDQLERLKVKY